MTCRRFARFLHNAEHGSIDNLLNKRTNALRSWMRMKKPAVIPINSRSEITSGKNRSGGCCCKIAPRCGGALSLPDMGGMVYMESAMCWENNTLPGGRPTRILAVGT